MTTYKTRKYVATGLRSAKLGFAKVYPYLLSDYHYKHINDISELDVVMAGYPKSGNTWLQNLVAGALFGMKTEYLTDKLTQDVVPDLDYKVIYKRYTDRMCFKTHDLPRAQFQKVIHLIRDPRDVMCSYWRMIQGRKGEVNIDDIVVNGDFLYFGRWSEHTKAWNQNEFDAELQVVRYEDLLTQPDVELKKIVDMLQLERTEEDLNYSILGNSIDNMREKETKFGFDKKFIAPENWVGESKFVRKGVKGGYKDELPNNIIEFIENECGDQMQQFGYEVT